MKLSPEHTKLYKAIDEILWNDWDPISMKFYKGPRDEYRRYVPSILNLKIGRMSVETIAAYLYKIESDRMGFTQGYEGCKQVAEKIFNLK